MEELVEATKVSAEEFDQADEEETVDTIEEPVAVIEKEAPETKEEPVAETEE